MPKVSVIIPTYNRAEFIEESIRFALNQTYKDLEVIVVDDGSTDRTREIIDSINDLRLRYFYQEHTGLPAMVRNRGLEEAKGEYISFLDSDDLLVPEAIEILKKFLDKNKNYGLAYGNIEMIGPKSQEDLAKFLRRKKRKSGKVFNELLLGNFIYCLAILIRRECFEKVGNFDEDPQIAMGEDWELFLKIAYHYNVKFVNNVFGFYVMHGENINNIDSIKSYLHQINVINKISSELRILTTLKNQALAIKYFHIGRYKLLQNDPSYKEDFRKAFLLNKYDLKSFLGLLLSFLPLFLAQKIYNFIYNMVINFI